MTDDKRSSEQANQPEGEKSTEDDLLDKKFLFRFKVLESFDRFVPYAAYVVIAYWMYLSIDSLAGKTTDVDIFNFIKIEVLSRPLPWWLSWVLTLAFVLWAAIERVLRKRKTKQLTERIRYLESQLDSQRTSSGLLPTGDTNPSDERR